MAVHQVDRFLSSHVVPKEALQLVGAVALMIANNHFCRLPHQDGERPVQEHGLNHAEDIVYWTDGTYTIGEVLAMYARKGSNRRLALPSDLSSVWTSAAL